MSLIALAHLVIVIYYSLSILWRFFNDYTNDPYAKKVEDFIYKTRLRNEAGEDLVLNFVQIEYSELK